MVHPVAAGARRHRTKVGGRARHRAAHRCSPERWPHRRMAVDRRQRLNVDERTRRPVLLLEFRLVRFEHANFAPAIEKQHDGARPDHQHKHDDDHFLGANNDLRAVWARLIIEKKIYIHC